MSEYKQTSFSGGMNLLLDDTRLPVSFKYKEGQTPYDITYNQYRLGLNIRTRFDVASPVPSSVVDTTAPIGIKQALISFGNYVILFCAGYGYYKLNGANGWTQINGFSMSTVAPRYWTCVVPLATTNYARFANPTDTSGSTIPSANAGINQAQFNQIAGSFANIPGLLVQDGVNQPQFIYIDQTGTIQCRITQTYQQWSFPIDPTTLALTGPDLREYVPIGTYMEWYNGILFIVDPAFTYIYRSVSGRPLDFVINVDINGQKGGDATTTSYSVGVSGITAMRSMPGNILFVAAGGSSCFSVTLNTNATAPTIFGEYTFIRTIMFNANCITERGIIDVLGDSVFIDANGLRSFNAVEQQQNEGRNSVFSSTVQSLFTGIFQNAPVTANTPSTPAGWCSAVLYDNYALFSVNTTLGYAIVVYDTINSCYQGLDITQLNGHAAKQFAAITISTLALYAITDDDRVVQLYASTTEYDTATIRLGSVCEQDPKKELKVNNVRAILTNITEDISVTCGLFINNRFSAALETDIEYAAPNPVYTGTQVGTDVGTQTNNLIFQFTDSSAQGWKAFATLTWNGGANLTSTSLSTLDFTPQNPPRTQAVMKLTK